MAEGEGIKLTEDSKQAVKLKGKAKQPTQAYGAISVSPGSSSSLRKSLVPIAELVPGQTIVNWEIQGLVVHKSEIESYIKKKKGFCCGIYFGFEMRDQAGGEIRVVGFDSEVSQFYAKVVEGKEHVLSRGRLIPPKEKFNHTNRRCEIVLEYNSEIRLHEDHEESNNKSLLERVTEIQKTLEFCTSKLRELETEIKKGGKRIVGSPVGTSAVVKTEAPDVVGVSENRAQAEKKIESPVMRQTSSSNTTRGAGLGTLPTRP